MSNSLYKSKGKLPSITNDDIVMFIKNTGATVYRVYKDRWKWQVATRYSECINRTLNGAIKEAIRDHDECVSDGETDAQWRDYV